MCICLIEWSLRHSLPLSKCYTKMLILQWNEIHAYVFPCFFFSSRISRYNGSWCWSWELKRTRTNTQNIFPFVSQIIFDYIAFFSLYFKNVWDSVIRMNFGILWFYSLIWIMSRSFCIESMNFDEVHQTHFLCILHSNLNSIHLYCSMYYV